MKKVEWLDGEYIFAVTRTFEDAAWLWRQHRYDPVVNDTRYDKNDFRGREAIEQLFGQLIQPNTIGNIEASFIEEEEQRWCEDNPF